MLIPFLVTRQAYAGAGKVLQTARGAVFCLSQRAEHIWEGVSSATTRSRPIINTRDEPHADAEKYRRLHVIVGDSNMSEYATFLKVGATSIVLRMLEDPSTVMRDLTLENPIRAIREISHDITCRRPVRLANGREMSALDIQGEYLQRAIRYRDRQGLSPQEDRALDMWEHCLKGLESDPLSLHRECDWVAKYRLIDRYRDRHGLSLHSPNVSLLDLQYHDVDRSRGLYYRLQRHDQLDRICDDADIAAAMSGAAPDHPGPPAGGVREEGQGAAPRLHRRLGPPQAQRPGPAHRAPERPLQVQGRAGGEADRGAVIAGRW